MISSGLTKMKTVEDCDYEVKCLLNSPDNFAQPQICTSGLLYTGTGLTYMTSASQHTNMTLLLFHILSYTIAL
jgi:hypothetical protein